MNKDTKDKKKEWCSIKSQLTIIPEYTEEEWKKMRQEVREIMELNMVLYGKW